jgi:hypothetical protein
MQKMTMTPILLASKRAGSCHFVAWGQFGHSVAGHDITACTRYSVESQPNPASLADLGVASRLLVRSLVG